MYLCDGQSWISVQDLPASPLGVGHAVQRTEMTLTVPPERARGGSSEGGGQILLHLARLALLDMHGDPEGPASWTLELQASEGVITPGPCGSRTSIWQITVQDNNGGSSWRVEYVYHLDGVGYLPAESAEELVDWLQELYLEETHLTRPICPGHSHPMKAAAESSPEWRCPATDSRVAGLGLLG